MSNNIYRIKDTGLDKVGGSLIYTPVASGAWIDIPARSNNFEFTVQTTDNVAERTNATDTSLLDFKPNEVSSIMAPRMTLRGLFPLDIANDVTNIIKLGRSKSIKRLSGGFGILDAFPETETDTYFYISVIVKNITMSEVVANGESYADITIQLEQVK